MFNYFLFFPNQAKLQALVYSCMSLIPRVPILLKYWARQGMAVLRVYHASLEP
jgi:hypothetical protein